MSGRIRRTEQGTEKQGRVRDGSGALDIVASSLPPWRYGSALRSVALGLAIGAMIGCSDDDDAVGTPSDDQASVTPGEPDTDGDEALGLLVAGLGGQPVDDVRSSWLVSTYLFRNPSIEPPLAKMTVGLLRYEGTTVADLLDFYANDLGTCERRGRPAARTTGQTKGARRRSSAAV